MDAETSAKVAAVMLNVFGKVCWQRTVPFVDRQVPDCRVLVMGFSHKPLASIDSSYLPDSPNVYLSGSVVKLQEVQFLPRVCVILEPFTEYSWYFDSDGDLQPDRTHILNANTANEASVPTGMKHKVVSTHPD